MTSTHQTSGSHLRPGAGVPRIVVSDVAVLAAIRAIDEDPELEFDDLSAFRDIATDTRTELTAATPYLIRDWVCTVLALYPHVLPGQLAELADGLLPEETS